MKLQYEKEKDISKLLYLLLFCILTRMSVIFRKL